MPEKRLTRPVSRPLGGIRADFGRRVWYERPQVPPASADSTPSEARTVGKSDQSGQDRKAAGKALAKLQHHERGTTGRTSNQSARDRKAARKSAEDGGLHGERERRAAVDRGPSTQRRSKRPNSTRTGSSRAGSARPTRKPGRRPQGGGKGKSILTAANADRHDLYQRSVQNPEEEAKFVAKTFRALRRREATALREDFCGTAAFCCAWVRLLPELNRATGLDIDREVLDWGRTRNLAGLGELADRVTLREQDVRESTPAEFDVVTAFNFSYWLFKTRPALREYFEAVHRSLKDDGVFFLDAYGGWEAHEPMREKRAVDGGFTYVWDQDLVDPINSGILNHIHFRFRDGTQLERAFTYDWRLWSLPEIRELLEEAGFADAAVYWDVAPEDEGEDYRQQTRAKNQPGWLAYIVACK
ncbi:MAG: methyltransferase domain-containing protein [Polyangiaceae bacterium]|nr:methyltransferase domain-containing protein [Polyangiaceae bacterium]